MPQLSLYIDQETLAKIEGRARARRLSISKYVANTLKKHCSDDWPEGFRELCGALRDDDSFRRPDDELPEDVRLDLLS